MRGQDFLDDFYGLWSTFGNLNQNSNSQKKPPIKIWAVLILLAFN